MPVKMKVKACNYFNIKEFSDHAIYKSVMTDTDVPSLKNVQYHLFGRGHLTASFSSTRLTV